MEVKGTKKLTKNEFQKLPVTVLSGFLGSGKTTLLRHLLEANHGMRIAMIVNDMGQINVDANRARVVQKKAKLTPKVVQMDNGCICCNLREDLLLEIKSLAKQQKFDYLLIESTGVSEPMPVAETFTFGDLHEHDHDHEHDHRHAEMETDDENEQQNTESDLKAKQGNDNEGQKMNQSKAMEVLSDIAELDCMVTVMDAKQFFDYLQDDADIFQKWGQSETVAVEDEGTSVCKLLIDQIEFANVILLNKTDLVKPAEMDKVYATARKLNPRAKIFKTSYSKIDPKQVINTGLFDFETAQYHAGWLHELRGQHVPETAEYGITSFTYNSRRPFSGSRLHDLLFSSQLQTQGVIRSKGSLWLDCADQVMTSFDICGASVQVYPEQKWFVDLKNNSPEEWEEIDEESKSSILKDFVGENGDRRQEMVFIGKDMSEAKIREMLNVCLLTDEELSKGKEVWSKAPSPFEAEQQEEESMSLTLQSEAGGGAGDCGMEEASSGPEDSVGGMEEENDTFFKESAI